MQTADAAQGAGTVPRRRQLEVVLAIAAVVLIATVGALLLAWASPFATSGAGAEGTLTKAGAVSAVVHDDAGNVHPAAVPTVVHDDAGNLKAR